MKDTLIILSFNKLAVTSRCVAAVVQKTAFLGETELIVVDNGSKDGSVEWFQTELAALCQARGVALKLILNDCNVGCSTARNQALAAARGDYVTFLDNDVEPAEPGWLAALRKRMETASENGMVGALMLYPPETGKPVLVQCAGVGISKRGHVCFIGRSEEASGARFQTAREVQCLISACMMIRRSLYTEYGGFDEIYNPVQFEDFDMCYNFRAHGWKAWFEPSAKMYHHESTTTAGSPSIRNSAVVVRNGLKFQKKWRQVFELENGPSEEECRWKKV